MAPILDGPGDVPPSSVKREALPQSPRGVRWRLRAADAPGGVKGAKLVAISDRSEREAWEASARRRRGATTFKRLKEQAILAAT